MNRNTSPVFAEERKTKILEILGNNKKVTVPELCRIFDVSGATVRTYLRELQDSGMLTRTHGGAIKKTQTGFELDSKQSEVQNLAEKKIIARTALQLINDGDKIILDTGTTTRELAKLLNQKKNITVLTNDLVIAGILEDYDSIDILMIGGIIRKNFHCTVGLQSKDIFKGLAFDKAFLGVNGFSFENGASTPNIDQANIKKLMIELSNKVILLCDSSKIGKISFAQFAPLQQIDTIISEKLDDKTKKILEEIDIEYYTGN